MRVNDRSISSASMQTVLTVPVSVMHPPLPFGMVQATLTPSCGSRLRAPPPRRRLSPGMKKASATDKGFDSARSFPGERLVVVTLSVSLYRF